MNLESGIDNFLGNGVGCHQYVVRASSQKSQIFFAALCDFASWRELFHFTQRRKAARGRKEINYVPCRRASPPASSLSPSPPPPLADAWEVLLSRAFDSPSGPL